MRIDPAALVAILGMALVTYATRASGLLLMNRVTLSKRSEAWLGYIPGSILISLVAPVVFSKGVPETAAAAITVLVAIRTGSLLLAMAIGVAAVWALRGLI
jgi:uncharacterized membrane protein